MSIFFDGGGFHELATKITTKDILKFKDTKSYGQRIKEAVTTTGEEEAIIIGKGKLEGAEIVVAALLHDIGDELAPMNHSQYAAAVLRPYVSEKTHWIIEKHGLFQTYYSAEHLGGNKNEREKYKNHKYYQATIDFCEKYDQSSFDPSYKSMTLKEFEPMVRNIFARKPFYHH